MLQHSCVPDGLLVHLRCLSSRNRDFDDLLILSAVLESHCVARMRGFTGGRFMLPKKTLPFVVCVLLFTVCPLLHGQATGSFSGTISDKSGSVISGATVTVTAQGTGASRESRTDDTG